MTYFVSYRRHLLLILLLLLLLLLLLVLLLLVVVLLNLYSAHHMQTSRGALHYKVKISQ